MVEDPEMIDLVESEVRELLKNMDFQETRFRLSEVLLLKL